MAEASPRPCANCPKAAVFIFGPDGGPQLALCLDCELKFVQLTTMQLENSERMMNYLADEATAVLGFPVPWPKFPARRTINNLSTGPVTLNRIRIDNSTIGVVNTGSIGAVDATITILEQAGEAEAARALQAMTQAIANAGDIAQETRSDLIDLLGAIAREAAAPAGQRRRAVALPLMSQVGSVLSGLQALSSLWAQYSPAILALFQ